MSTPRHDIDFSPKHDEPLRDGEACTHPGCLSHLSHPCEGCGRIGGVAAPLEPTIKYSSPAEKFAHEWVWSHDTDTVYLLAEMLKAYAAAVSKNLTTKMERERDAAVVTLRAMCGDNWQSMDRNFAESLASIENEKKRAENLQEELAALRTRWNFALKGEDEALRECRRLEMEIAALRTLMQRTGKCHTCPDCGYNDGCGVGGEKR